MKGRLTENRRIHKVSHNVITTQIWKEKNSTELYYAPALSSDSVNNVFKSITQRARSLAFFEASDCQHLEGRACVCACISHGYSSRPYQWCVVLLVIIHPSICIQAMSKSQQGGINARVSQEEHMSVCYGKVRGIFAETSKRQQFRRRTAD